MPGAFDIISISQQFSQYRKHRKISAIGSTDTELELLMLPASRVFYFCRQKENFLRFLSDFVGFLRRVFNFFGEFFGKLIQTSCSCLPRTFVLITFFNDSIIRLFYISTLLLLRGIFFVLQKKCFSMMKHERRILSVFWSLEEEWIKLFRLSLKSWLISLC